jgi:sortase (surface protein transpeptidase)
MRLLATAAAVVALAGVTGGTPAGVGRLRIPSIAVDVPITGDLATGVEFWPGVGGRPGGSAGIAIAGHDVTAVPGFGEHGPFNRLHLIRRGALLTIRWRGRSYGYRVTRVAVEPATNDQMPVFRAGWVTLSTCWPPYSAANRWLVYAQEINE